MTHAEHRAYKKVDQRNRPCDLSRLYCYIPRLDLQNKNFSNVYFELQEAISKYE